jgi:ribosome-associated translation inhibitor RaiA
MHAGSGNGCTRQALRNRGGTSMTDSTRHAVINVRSSNIHLGPVLPVRARDGIARIASKYSLLRGASVYFRQEGRSYSCTVNIDLGMSKIVTAKASGFDCYLALQNTLRKAATQLRRMKRASSTRPRLTKVWSSGLAPATTDTRSLTTDANANDVTAYS